MERESMQFDVLIVGAGPAGLACAIKLKQLAKENAQDISVCILEKGSEVGAHILSGAVFETRALDELIPDWQSQGAPINTHVTEDEIYLLSENKASKRPNFSAPKTMHNSGNYIVSMANVCRWLAEYAEQLEVEIFPGFAAAQIHYNDDGSVGGVITGDMGVDADGQHKDSYMPGMLLEAKYTVFAEGCRGHLGKELIKNFKLDANADPQHYAIGFKEVWDIPAEQHHLGRVIHSAGWPLDQASGGSFMYHAEENQVYIGLIVDLNYRNPHLSPYDEFQRMKHHPLFAEVLKNGKRVSYGARAIAKGGFNSLPELSFPGGVLVGCNAGTLNFAKIKGNHTAMKSGSLAAESIAKALASDTSENLDLQTRFKQSWLYDELYSARNFGAAIHKFGTFFGGVYNSLEQNIFKGRMGFNIRDKTPDHEGMQLASEASTIAYPKYDGVLSFDKLSSVFLSNTNHEDDQPCHLKLEDDSIPIAVNFAQYLEPAQRYCPAGVYEVITSDDGEHKFQINAQNCIHCKTCDIKDPSQNIRWTVPEGAGGPNYPNM